MSGQSARVVRRRPTRGGVLVYRLGGGPSFKGTLADLGSDGARLILDRPLDSGEVIRVIFPRKGDEANRPGRMILGQVVHSQAEPGGHVVGVVFGWDAAVKESTQPTARKAGLMSWFRLFWKKAAPRSPAGTARR
jgi:hypothetical protein